MSEIFCKLKKKFTLVGIRIAGKKESDLSKVMLVAQQLHVQKGEHKSKSSECDELLL